jgi:hypothetical protein
MTCCVEACEESGTHRKVFSIEADGWGDVEASAVFCCSHFDQLLDGVTLLDLGIVGRLREPAA